VKIDYHFPTIIVQKMAKMPMIPDPRYSHSKKHQFEAQKQLQQDVSAPNRFPYPQPHEIGLPRHKQH